MVGEILQGYADRGVFRGFSRGESRNGKAAFRMIWHRERPFDLTVDTRRGAIHCPVVLPQLPAGSEMYRKFRAFLKACQSADRPDHRRIDDRKARVACANRGGNVSLTMTLGDADYEYAIRKFIHLIQEIYLVFLSEYFEYQVEGSVWIRIIRKAEWLPIYRRDAEARRPRRAQSVLPERRAVNSAIPVFSAPHSAAPWLSGEKCSPV